jgi:hypothetical protein
MSSGRSSGLTGRTTRQTSRFTGRVLLPGDDGYDDLRRPLNPTLDRAALRRVKATYDRANVFGAGRTVPPVALTAAAS